MVETQLRTIESVRSEILEHDTDFGKRCLDYFDSLHLQDIDIGSLCSIEGRLPLEDSLNVEDLCTHIDYKVVRSPNIGYVGNSYITLFNISLTSLYLDGFEGWIRLGGIKTKGYIGLNGIRGLELQKKFLDEMFRASETLGLK